MKAVKALKRLAEIETMLSKIVERYAGNERSIQEVLRDAREAVIRAR